MNTFSMSQGAGQKLEFAFQRHSGTAEDLEWLSTGENLKSVILLARGEAELIPKVVPEFDSIIRVDHSIKPSYPRFVFKALTPELEKVGPVEYGAESINEWSLEGQGDGNTFALAVYIELLKDDMKLLKTCLGLQDLKEIEKKGVGFFRKYFKAKMVFAWKSVVLYENGRRAVPCLSVRWDKVVLRWFWLDAFIDDSCSALRHASSSHA